MQKQHQEVHFTEKHHHGISVPPPPQDNEGDEDLKEFLSPVLRMTRASKVKKFGAHMKTYAQVIDIDVGAIERKASKTQKDKEMITRKNENEPTKTKEMFDVVECMKRKIDDLSKIIVEIVSHGHVHNAV